MSSANSLRLGLAGGVVLLAGLASRGEAEAGAITYKTEALLGPGPAAVRIEAVGQGTYSGAYDPSAAPMPLARFVVTPAPAGTTQTFDHVPFRIEWSAPELERSEPILDPEGHFRGARYDIANFGLSGHLDGAVDSDGHSTLTASLDSVDRGMRPYPAVPNEFRDAMPFRVSDLRLGDLAPQNPPPPAGQDEMRDSLAEPVGSWPLGVEIPLVSPADGGITTLEARVVPEPTTLALFTAAIAGLAWRRRSARPVSRS